MSFQRKFDDWYRERKGQTLDLEAYKSFLREIGYLVEEGGLFSVETDRVDLKSQELPAHS